VSSQTSPPPDSQSPDDAAVRTLYQQLMEAWNKGSGEGYAAPFAADGDFIGCDGMHFKDAKRSPRFISDSAKHTSRGPASSARSRVSCF
jgi:uncharacterized protein (TIGR02246 family)